MAKDTINRIYAYEKYKHPIEKNGQKIWTSSKKTATSDGQESFEKMFHLQTEVTIRPSLYSSETNNTYWLE